MKHTRIIGIILSIIIMASLVACQTTPEHDYISNKGEDDLLDIIINESADPTAASIYAAPERWNDVLVTEPNTNTPLTVSIQAEVTIPEVKTFPVYTVKPDKFTAKQIANIVESLFGSTAKLYKVETTGRIMTKLEVEERIIQIRSWLSDPTSEINNASNYSSLEDMEAYKQELLQEIERLEKKHKTAPEEYTPEEIEITPQTLADGLFSYIEYNNGETAGFYVSATEVEQGRYNSVTCFIKPGNLRKSISVEDACPLALAFVPKLGITDMAINTIIPSKDNFADGYCFYDIVLTKTYEGMPTTYTVQEQDYYEQNVYTCPWMYEKLIIRVDCNGILSFGWYSPSMISEKLADNIQLLPFETIQENFKKQIFYHAVWYDDHESIISRKLIITDVRLGYMRINVKERLDEYILVPVWDFFGYSIDKYSEQQPGGWALDENNEHLNLQIGYSYLTLNAIDGSVINRSFGY